MGSSETGAADEPTQCWASSVAETGATQERTLFAVACKPLFGPDAAALPSTGLERHRCELRRETEIHLADRLVPIL